MFCKEDKEVVLTDGKGLFSTQLLHDVHTPAPCTHEEHDSRILHISHAALHDHHNMLIPTVDPDVVVLAVFAINHLPAGYELWLALGTGKSFHYLAAHQIVASHRPEIVSSFAGHGKKTAWSTWKSLPELTDALLMLAD